MTDTNKEINNLIKRCEEFTRLAGMLAAPPVMLEDLINKTTFIYASSVLHYLNSLNHKNEEIEDLIKEVNKYSNKPLSFNNDVVLSMYLNLDDWINLTPFMRNNLENLPDNLSIVFTKIQHPEKHQGLFDPSNNKIFIYIPTVNINNKKDFLYNLFNIKETARHELQHYAQMLITYLSNSKSWQGLPPIKYRNKSTEIQLHPLRDEEFYTNLQDSINLFKEKIKERKMNHNLIRLFAKSWIGLSDEFFQTMQSKIDSNNKWSEEQKQYLLNKLIDMSKPKLPFNVLKTKDENKWKLASKIFWDKVSYLF